MFKPCFNCLQLGVRNNMSWRVIAELRYNKAHLSSGSEEMNTGVSFPGATLLEENLEHGENTSRRQLPASSVMGVGSLSSSSIPMSFNCSSDDMVG